MPFDHERLDVYQAALDFAVIANDAVQGLPRGRSHISDQLTRASISIVLNIAEGTGKYSKADKRRYYLSAAGSATECAAALDLCKRLGLIEEQVCERGKGVLDRIVAMLVKLAARLA
jgi:four helix bundle protein